MQDDRNQAPSYADLEKKTAAEKLQYPRATPIWPSAEEPSWPKASNMRVQAAGAASKPLSYAQAGYDEPQCQASPVGQAVAGKQHLLSELESRRRVHADLTSAAYADFQRHGDIVARLAQAINILTLNPNFAEFCELLGLKVP